MCVVLAIVQVKVCDCALGAVGHRGGHGIGTGQQGAGIDGSGDVACGGVDAQAVRQVSGGISQWLTVVVVGDQLQSRRGGGSRGKGVAAAIRLVAETGQRENVIGCDDLVEGLRILVILPVS